LRMMKCKQKISGGFRCFEFAVSFANGRVPRLKASGEPEAFY